MRWASFRTSQQPKRYSSKCGLGASADGQFEKDTFDVRFHRLRRDLKCPSDVLIGATLADQCQDIALPCCQSIAAAAAELRGMITRRAGIPPRQQACRKRYNFAIL